MKQESLAEIYFPFQISYTEHMAEYQVVEPNSAKAGENHAQTVKDYNAARQNLFGTVWPVDPITDASDTKVVHAAANAALDAKIKALKAESDLATAKLTGEKHSISELVSQNNRPASPFDTDQRLAQYESAQRELQVGKPGDNLKKSVEEMTEEAIVEEDNEHERGIKLIRKVGPLAFLGIGKRDQVQINQDKSFHETRLQHIQDIKTAILEPQGQSVEPQPLSPTTPVPAT